MTEYLKNISSTFSEQLSGFIKFLFEKNIFQAGIAFVVASQVNKLFFDFIANIVTPITERVMSQDIKKIKTNVFGAELQIGNFALSVLNFIIVIIFLFYLYKISDSSKTMFENIIAKIKSIF
jgi:large-conductance mechanosensitive channel